MVIKHSHASVHLTEDQLERASGVCVFCQGRRLRREVRLQSDPEVWLQTCGDCRIASADRVPRPSVLREYYDRYYDSRPGRRAARTQDITLQRSDRLAGRIHGQTNRNIGHERVRILDFGGGDGTLATSLAERLLRSGADSVGVTLVEISDAEATADSSKVEIEQKPQLTHEDRDSYQIVIASAVLEHLTAPAEVLRSLLGALVPGGVFYARTPSHLATAKLLSRFGQALDFGFPAHLHDMGATFWNRALTSLDLSDAYELQRSAPSIVASTWRSDWLRTLAATAIKLPWYVLGDRYALVGGWEVVIRRLEV